MARKVSMDDIARKVGLSKNTVSLVLRGMPGISADTRLLISRTAQEMGYHYKQSGIDRQPASRNLCIIVPTIAHDRQGFFAHIQLGIEQEAKKHHFNTIFHSYEENAETFQLPLCVREGLVSGIISVGRVSEKTVSVIGRCGIPFVVTDHYLENVREDCVLTDNIQSARFATEYLIGKGHRDIGFVGDIGATVSFRDRYFGFLNAMAKHGLPVKEQHCITHAGLDGMIRQDQAIAVSELEKMHELPTAFFCANDAGAIALYRAFFQMGVSIPGTVSVMGFDDTDISGLVVPELTTMRVHKELMGRKAFLRLMAKIHDRKTVPERLLLAAELVERQSVRDLT